MTGQLAKEVTTGKSKLIPGQKIGLVILGMGNPGEVSKLCEQHKVYLLPVVSVEEAVPRGGLGSILATEQEAQNEELKQLGEMVGSSSAGMSS